MFMALRVDFTFEFIKYDLDLVEILNQLHFVCCQAEGPNLHFEGDYQELI